MEIKSSPPGELTLHDLLSLGFLQHWQAIDRFSHLVALRHGFQNAGFLFFGEKIKRLGFASFGFGHSGMQKVGDAAFIRKTECHGMLLLNRYSTDKLAYVVMQSHYKALSTIIPPFRR